MTSPKAWRPKKDPWAPADYDDDLIYAVRAVNLGQANEGQQRLVWSWVMYLTGAGDEFADLSFRPGPQGDRDTTFAEGKRFVGLQLRKMLHPSVTPTEEEPDDRQKRRR